MAAKKRKPKIRHKKVGAGEKASQVTESTVIKALGLSGGMFGAAPCAVDVKDGKIVRIRPLHYDSKYDPKQFNPWKITKNGKKLGPLVEAKNPFFWKVNQENYRGCVHYDNDGREKSTD